MKLRGNGAGVFGGLMVAGFLLVLGGCSGGGSDAPVATAQVGTVSGQVVSADPGNAPVAGAKVSTSAGMATSGNDGSFTVSAPANDRAVVHVEANGFAEASPVTRVISGQTTTIGVKLLPVGATAAVNVGTGGTVTVLNSTAQVSLPANGLVPKNGGAASGTVNVSVTPINPAVDPNLMPGDFTGVSAGGTTPIESFGAIVVDIRDNAGNRYNLAAGRTATIRIPLGTQNPNPPATLPLWYFNETTGLWIEEGTATLLGNAPDQYYEGTVTHFSTWNADQPALRTWVSGCVRDANGQPVANAWVQSNGTDYTGSDMKYTAADGSFRVGVRKGGTATIGVVEWSLNPFSFGPISNSLTVTSLATDPTDFVRTLSNCLVVRPAVLTITTLALVGGNVNDAYSQTLAAVGGVPGYVWSLDPTSNPLPVGLSLSPSGVISGSPTTAGTTTIVVRVADTVGGFATQQLSLTISPAGVVPIAISSLSPLPAGTVGANYSVSLAATGGTGARVWSVVSGALPAGLTLNASTGQIGGTPATQGTSTFMIRVQDSAATPQSDQRAFSLLVNVATTGGSGGGTLTVSNGPASVGGTFAGSVTSQNISGGAGGVVWGETSSGSLHAEVFGLLLYNQPGLTYQLVFSSADGGVAGIGWTCVVPALSGFTTCSGVTINQAGGTVTLANTVLSTVAGSPSAPPITLNGTLNFTPF